MSCLKLIPDGGRLDKTELCRFNEHVHYEAHVLEYILKNELCPLLEANRAEARAKLISAAGDFSLLIKHVRKNKYFSEKKWKLAYFKLLKWYELVFGDIRIYKEARKKARADFFKRQEFPRCKTASPKNMEKLKNSELRLYRRFRLVGDGVANRCYDNAFNKAKDGVEQIMGYLVHSGRIIHHSWNFDKAAGVVIEHSPMAKSKDILYFGVPCKGRKFPESLEWNKLFQSTRPQGKRHY
jgi:hypothetical protein